MNRFGGSLIELIAAVIVVGVGVTAVASLTATAAQATARARALDETHAVLRNLVDSLRLAATPGEGRTALPSGTVTWGVPSVPAEDAWVQFDHVALQDSIRVRFTVVSDLHVQ
ncbi:MAG: hypothetical protein F4Y24_18015 [Gemmatimonadetes bacterium]|nr:hypothetical protein [Gemmatimonadota bacterium]MYG22950.1 hypothetical protein [Gemmatimonadota bacterium]MYJ39465.1 hypothetical protein [Gemmatimonadota bacterium]